jgi:hypothetical protein
MKALFKHAHPKRRHLSPPHFRPNTILGKTRCAFEHSSCRMIQHANITSGNKPVIQASNVIRRISTIIIRRTWAIAWSLVVASFLHSAAWGQSVVDAGTVQVPTLGHSFSPATAGGGPTVKDFFIDQKQNSGGGGLIGNVSANFDTNNTFRLTITAPPGNKFLVHVPASGSVRFGGRIIWTSANGYYAYYSGGTVNASFSGLVGNAPTFVNAEASIAQDHSAFGYESLYSSSLSADISFTSITLTGAAFAPGMGSGTQSYMPNTNSANVFYATYSPPLGQTSDPGRFVSIVPMVPGPTLQIAQASSGVAMKWPTNFNDWMLETATQLGPTSTWTLSTNGRVVSGTNFVITNMTTEPSRYFRLRRQ